MCLIGVVAVATIALLHHPNQITREPLIAHTATVLILLSAFFIGYQFWQRQKKLILASKVVEMELLKFRAAIEQSPSIIMITDVNGAIEYVNPAFSRVTGYSFEEVRGQKPRILKSGELEANVYADLWKAIASGEEWRGEFHNKKKNGELFWELASISPIRDSSGKIIRYLAVKEDITRRKQAEMMLEEYSLNLENMVEERTLQRDSARVSLFMAEKLSAMGRMAAGIAHQLNSPLGGGMLYVDALIDRWEGPDEGREHLFRLRDLFMHMRDIIDAMLAIARVKKRSESARVQANINAIIDRVLNMSSLECRNRGICVERIFGNDLPLIPAHLGDLDQVVINIVNNAIDAMEKGGKLSITSVRANDGVRICIHDTGSGILPEHMDHIFEPFFTTRPGSKGTGLGLSIANEIVDRYQGKISVQSTAKGTEFAVWLPSDGITTESESCEG